MIPAPFVICETLEPFRHIRLICRKAAGVVDGNKSRQHRQQARQATDLPSKRVQNLFHGNPPFLWLVIAQRM